MSSVSPDNWRIIVPPTTVTATGGLPLVVTWTLYAKQGRRLLVGDTLTSVAVTGNLAPVWALTIPGSSLLVPGSFGGPVVQQALMFVGGSVVAFYPMDVQIFQTGIIATCRNLFGTVATGAVITDQGLPANWSAQPANLTGGFFSSIAVPGHWQFGWDILE